MESEGNESERPADYKKKTGTMIQSKKKLEVMLSRLKGFNSAKSQSEQYITPSAIAAEVLWKAYHNGDIEGRVIADYGSGTGILGIGALLLGASKVYFIDNDEEAIKTCKSNLGMINEIHRDKSEGSTDFREVEDWECVYGNVNLFRKMVDCVIMNPPFGTRTKHADRAFLEHAFRYTNVTYSFHKSTTAKYIVRFAEQNGFSLKETFLFKFMLWNTMSHHTKKQKYIDVSCLAFENKEEI